MTYALPFGQGQKVVELGGGDAPSFHPNVDVRQGPHVDVVCDLSRPIPLPDGSFDGLFSKFALEHVSWRAMPSVVKEACRLVKPGGTAVFIVPNTLAQMKWALEQPDDAYDKVAQCLFGDQDYRENAHQAAFSPAYAMKVFREAGFSSIAVIPYGETRTDMVVEARKPVPATSIAAAWTTEERKKAFDRRYWNGGTGGVGGYAREGYWDYPCHWTTFRKIMDQKPGSVLEIGCARGYLIKRLQDAGVRAAGLEVSRHCLLTRATNGIKEWDLTETPWPFQDGEFDLCFSIAVLEHVPEHAVERVAAEVRRVSKRGLHGVDFGEHDDGFDKTHCTLKSKKFWIEKLNSAQDAGPVPQVVVDKEDLERGPVDLPKPDGKLKLNIGCKTTMFHHGWVNIDMAPLHAFAQQHGYLFEQRDLRQGPLYASWKADLVYAGRFLEHLTYEEGEKFLREVRGAMKPGGTLRIAVPNLRTLAGAYLKDDGSDSGPLSYFDEVDGACAASPQGARKLWELLAAGHKAFYDQVSLVDLLMKTGFSKVGPKAFRESSSPQMLVETIDLLPDLSLYVEGNA